MAHQFVFTISTDHQIYVVILCFFNISIIVDRRHQRGHQMLQNKKYYNQNAAMETFGRYTTRTHEKQLYITISIQNYVALYCHDCLTLS